MSVINTSKLLREFITKRKETSLKHLFQLQNELLCQPIAEVFEEFHSTQIHKYFLENGMFYPDAKIVDEIKHFEKTKLWSQLQMHYQYLKKEWDGKEVKIYVYPVEKRNELIMNDLNGKMGVSFHEVIALFLSKELSIDEIKALLTHEYNHVCRLSCIQKDFQQITLLDSMLIEGMAEVAVEEYFGKKALAPWISRYTLKDLYPYWQRVKSSLSIRGKEKHDPILYGDGTYRGFPKWFGYCIGYHLVKAYLYTFPKLTSKELLNKSSEEILSDSDIESYLTVK